jgi:hypothetical protein
VRARYNLAVHRIAALPEQNRRDALIEEALAAAGNPRPGLGRVRAAAEAMVAVPGGVPLEGPADISYRLSIATFRARKALGRVRQ